MRDLIKVFLGTLCVSGMMYSAAWAQDDELDDTVDGLETLDEQEQTIPAMPRVRGPITIIQPGALLFATFDQDTDYVITRSEVEDGVKASFKTADRDSSGRLTLFELEDWREKALGSLGANPGNLSFDTDFDNQVSREEFSATIASLFDRHDVDESGTLIFSEIMQVLEVPRRQEVEKERMSDRECYEQINRGRF